MDAGCSALISAFCPAPVEADMFTSICRLSGTVCSSDSCVRDSSLSLNSLPISASLTVVEVEVEVEEGERERRVGGGMAEGRPLAW